MLNENELWFIERTVKHIRRVQDNMILLAKNIDKLPFDIRWNELIERSMCHDLSKFSNDLFYGFVRLSELQRANKGKFDTSLKYEDFIPFIQRHREIERHHPHTKSELNPLDICEMCCDLVAISQEFNEDDYTQYFKEKLIKEAPILEKYKDECLSVLVLLQNVVPL